MAIDNNTLRRWAGGGLDNPAPMDEEDDLGEMEDLEDEMPEEGESERNPLWAGEPLEDEEGEIAVEELDEDTLMGMMDWLEENEPEIHAAIEKMAAAVESGDDRLIEAAKLELKAAEQYLNPEYPPLTPSQQEKASKNISALSKEGKDWPGGQKQMVAVGLAKARKGESV